MSETLIPAYYNTKINNHDWVIYMGGERYFPAYPAKRTEPEPEYPNYLTFEALEDGEIGWWTNPDSDVEVHVFWSKDKENWTEFTQNDDTADYISVSSGENLYCRGINLDGVSGQYALEFDACNGFVQNFGKWDIKGNIMSLIDYNNMATMTEMVGNFYWLFGDDHEIKHGKTIDIVNAIDLILPATTLANDCYEFMFRSCNSLTTAPVLPATTLANYCYSGMFQGCSSLVTAPLLPSTTLSNGCYQRMFYYCTSLTEAPELPAATLAYGCYEFMFSRCSGLTTAPELPATTLTSSCYYGMFEGCSNLNYIKCLAVNGIIQSMSTSDWVNGVQTNSGTFIKHQNATSWLTDSVNGIPTNWTVEDAQ